MSNQDQRNSTETQSQSKTPDDLRKMREKINAVTPAVTTEDKEQPNNLGIGLRYASEFSAAVLVGTALGYGGDKLFGTAPWLMLLGLIFGCGAGVLNIVRASQEQMKAAQDAQQEEQDEI
ncbi:AtpZ/AtpI family protein [Robiginitomaculum antarcticum]|uniref:AtpZ/AtpI family protein n=1 Tax=Robiginitomaculum antarcticum TaxID=437507 RepID=UPI0003670666|nr:AtpZ/AtpI family protein [Robiginitomaculum antarcticum]